MQIGSSDSVKRSVSEGRVTRFICAVLHPGGWNHIHFIFAAGTQNFPVSARKTGVSKRKEKMVFVECFPAPVFSHVSKTTSSVLPEYELI